MTPLVIASQELGTPAGGSAFVLWLLSFGYWPWLWPWE